MLGSPRKSGSPFSGVAASEARRPLTGAHNGQTVALGGAEADGIRSVPPSPAWVNVPTGHQPSGSQTLRALQGSSLNSHAALAMDVP